MSQVPPPFPTDGMPPPSGFPAQPGGDNAPAAIRPGKKWFWIGGATIVIGAIAAIVIGIIGILNVYNTVDGFEDVRPDGGSITLDQPGGYVIYSADQFGSVPRVAVTSPSGEIIDLTRYVGDLTYDLDGEQGRAAYTFQAEQAGTYQVVTDRPVAIGESIGGDLVRAILTPMAIGLVMFFLGLAVIMITAIRRSTAKKPLIAHR
jgi:hypothetical protein